MKTLMRTFILALFVWQLIHCKKQEQVKEQEQCPSIGFNGQGRSENRLNGTNYKSIKIPAARNPEGRQIPSLTASLAIGRSGEILLRDVNLIGQLAKFHRERIPERIAHARGTGAHGYFYPTADITNYTRAIPFATLGKKTPVFVRLSNFGGSLGSPDTLLDAHGFATKFYTPEGNWDMLGTNQAVFNINDPILFPSFTRTVKRNPKTHIVDYTSPFDFFGLRPEATYNLMLLFGANAYPDGYRHMNAYSVHAFKFVNKKGEAFYVKFHWITIQGVKSLSREKAKMLLTEPDYYIKDLYDAIERKDFPSWDLYIQLMTFDQAAKYRWNPFDATKEWLKEDFPLQRVGRMTLNRNPTDFFTEVEMAAFDPGNLIPGIEFSPDRLLIGRSFSYLDAQRYRLGTNFAQLNINRPLFSNTFTGYDRDGAFRVGPKNNGNGGPNYFPNSFGGPTIDPHDPEAAEIPSKVPPGDIERFDTGNDDNFSQAQLYLKRISKKEREILVHNAAHAFKDIVQGIRDRALENLRQVEEQLYNEIRIAIKKIQASEKDRKV